MENDEKTRILKLCTDFLTNAWSEVSIQDIEFEQLFAGYGNKTYHCSIKNCSNLPKYEQTHHKEVIVRVYGSDLFAAKDAIKFNGESGEALIIHILSEIGLAPKLLGVFSGGVIVEFIASRPSLAADWKDMEMCALFARKLAKLHNTVVPIAKRPQLLEKGLKFARSVNRDSFDFASCSENRRKQIESIVSFPIEEEYEWIQRNVSNIASKIVFSHNDVNINNILVKHHYDSIDDKIVFIDFELSTSYYRGFDIAYFLIMKNIVVETNGSKNTIVSCDRREDSGREVVITEYLVELKKLNPQDFDPNLDTIDHLSMEVYFFDLVYYTFLAMIAMPVIFESKIELPLSYFEEQLSGFQKKKEAFVREYSYLLDVN